MIAYRTLIACVIAGLVGCSGRIAVTDAGLKAKYEENPASFAKLAAMLQEDERLQIINRDGTAEGDAVDEARLAEYRAVISELGLDEPLIVSLHSDDDYLIELTPRAGSDEFSTSEKVGVRGLAYSSEELPVAESVETQAIDKMNVDDKRYILIAPNWYTFLHRIM